MSIYLSAETFTERLALTLVHFVWQGLVVTAVLIAVSGLLRPRRPASRYALNLFALVAMAACPMLTFLAIQPSFEQPRRAEAVLFGGDQSPVAATPKGARATTTIVPAHVATEDPAVWRAWLPAAERWIVLGWIIGAALLGVRLLLGWVWLQRLKQRIERAPDNLVAQAERLCRALHLRLPRIHACRNVREAIATGLIRPMILIPMSWLAELPPDMLEAVLAHELAHLRRWDLWVNAFQRLVEALLFYHPAVWWVSRRMRIERELCCDELAVALTHDRLHYVQTLERVGRLVSFGKPADLAVSMGGERMNLLLRVRHLLNPRPAPRAALPWLAGLLAVLLPVAAWWGVSSYARSRNTAAAGEVTATLVDAQGLPVAGQALEVYRYGQRLEQSLHTDAKGQFKVDRAWRTGEEEGYTLIARAKDRIGWFDFAQNSNPKADDSSFQMMLVPLDQSVSGILTDPKGNPLAGVRVAASGFHRETNRYLVTESIDGDAVVPTVATDASGRFAMRVPAGTQGELQPRHPDWTALRIPWKKDQGDLGRVALTPGGRIEGRVVDARTGQPLTRVRVGAQAYQPAPGTGGFGEAACDERGRYVIGGLHPGQYNVLFLALPGDRKLTAPAVEAVTVQPGKPANADFQASEGRLLAGKVIDSDTGKPLARCHVGYYGSARPQSGAACMMVRTDADGTFQFHVPPGVSHVYTADGSRAHVADSGRTIEVAANRDPEPLILKAGSARSDVGETTICLTPEQEKKQREEPAYRLHVHFRSSDGRPVTKIDLRMVHVGSRYFSETAFTSGTSFERRFPASDEGSRAFYLVDARGFAPTRSPEFVITKTMPTLTIDLRPEVPVLVRGRVLDLQDKPLAGARIRTGKVIYVRQEDFPWGVETVTDAEGRFTIKHTRVGDRFFIRVDKAGTGGAETEPLTITKAEPIELSDLRVGPPDQVIKGRVRDQNNVSVPGAHIVYRGDTVVDTTSDNQGRFELRGLPAGRLELSVSAPGFHASTPSVRAGAAEAVLFMSRLPASDGVSDHFRIRLQPKDGKTVAKTKLWVFNQTQKRLLWSTEFQGNEYESQMERKAGSKQENHFALVIAAEGYAHQEPVLIAFGEKPQPVALEVNLEPAAAVKLRGRVLGEDGKPFAGVRIGVSRELMGKTADEPWRFNNDRDKAPLTDAAGRFEIAGIQPGSRMAVYVNKAGYAGAWSTRLTVDKAHDLQLPDLVLKKATRELTGRVLNDKNQPVADARVYDYDLAPVETKTDADGRFRLQGVPGRDSLLVVDSLYYQVKYAPAAMHKKELIIRLMPE